MAVLAAIDEKERSKKVVEIAYDLATTYDDTLVALHVVPRKDFESHRRSIESIPGMTEFSIDQEADSARKFAQEFAREAVDDLDSEQLETRGRVGNVIEGVLAEAASLEPRFLVISGRRRSPAGKAVFGNTAQQILLNAACPVVTQLSDQ